MMLKLLQYTALNKSLRLRHHLLQEGRTSHKQHDSAQVHHEVLLHVEGHLEQCFIRRVTLADLAIFARRALPEGGGLAVQRAQLRATFREICPHSRTRECMVSICTHEAGGFVETRHAARLTVVEGAERGSRMIQQLFGGAHHVLDAR